MRRTAIACAAAAAALITSALPSTAAPPPPRVVEGSYQDPALIVGHQFTADMWATSTFAVPPGPERFVTVQLIDDAGGTVYAMLEQDGDGDGNYNDLRLPICDRTQLPIFVKPDAPLRVRVYRGTCYGSNDVSATTRGKIVVTLSTTAPKT